MRTVEEITSDIGFCIENLHHLVKVNSEWKAELSSIDQEIRPVGYANQISGIRQQELAFESETKRLIALEAEKWISSLGDLNEKELEFLKTVLKNASAEVQKRLKSLENGPEKSDESLF